MAPTHLADAPPGGCASMARRMLIFRVAPCIAPPPVQTSLGAGGGSITVSPPPTKCSLIFASPQPTCAVTSSPSAG